MHIVRNSIMFQRHEEGTTVARHKCDRRSKEITDVHTTEVTDTRHGRVGARSDDRHRNGQRCRGGRVMDEDGGQRRRRGREALVDVVVANAPARLANNVISKPSSLR